LGIFVLAIWSWLIWHDLGAVFLFALMSVLCFLLTYLVSGWVYNYLATYQLTQDGLIKSSPLRTQRVHWKQVVKLRWEVLEDIWWLMDSRGRTLLTIDWRLLPPEKMTATLKAHIFRHFQQQWENLFTEWAAKGKVFRPSVGNLLSAWLGLLTLIALAITCIALGLTFWERSNLFWKALWALPALRGIWGIWLTLRLLTLRVSVRGDWLFVSKLFQTTRLHLGSVTEVLPIVTCPLSDGSQKLEGLELKSGSAQVRISDEVCDFSLLCLYLASKLPSPWNAVVKALTIRTILGEKIASLASPCPKWKATIQKTSCQLSEGQRHFDAKMSLSSTCPAKEVLSHEGRRPFYRLHGGREGGIKGNSAVGGSRRHRRSGSESQ